MLVFKVNIFGGSFYINHTSLIFFYCMVNGQIPTHNLLEQSTIVLVRIDQVILQKQIIPQISMVYFLLTECLLRFWATVQGKCLSIWLLSDHLFAFPPSYSCTIWVKWTPQLMMQQKREFWPRSKPPLLQPKTDAHSSCHQFSRIYLMASHHCDDSKEVKFSHVPEGEERCPCN